MSKNLFNKHRSSGSWSSDDGSLPSGKKPLDPPVLVYHESARSIVFRDQLRRAVGQASKPQHDTITDLAKDVTVASNATTVESSNATTNQIVGFRPRIQPLPTLELGPNDIFSPLVENSDQSDWTAAEIEVVTLLENQHACVKTIKNADWTSFLNRFREAQKSHGRSPREHDDNQANELFPFVAFVTSTTMLPELGRKMRCFGSHSQYTTGVVFALPTRYTNETEEEVVSRTQTWSWPAGYSAKTEFNIDGRGQLINGRQEALRNLSTLRGYNNDYLHKNEYMIGSRIVSGLNQIPYNEVFLRVGGLGRIVNGRDVATGRECIDGTETGRSLNRGVGLPVAIYCRTASFGHLISLLRTRARLMHTLGEVHFKSTPLLLITPELGVRVLTERLQRELWKIASSSLNPFQNPSIAYKTTVEHTDDQSFQQKVDELLHLDESIQEMLTPEELARLAGGFGATDESVATILQRLVVHDRQQDEKQSAGDSTDSKVSHRLQDVVNEGLAAAVRAGDYHTSRQLLILYSLVASRADEMLTDQEDGDKCESDDSTDEKPKKAARDKPAAVARESSLGTAYKEELELARRASANGTLAIPAAPPPPPLDTDRLRSATNSDGLLAVLGAAQVLKAMQDGGAKRRTLEAVSAVDEWVNYGEQSMAFRISSWYDQRAAQGDLKIATEKDSNFMAFVSNKAIANRKSFAEQLRRAALGTNFEDVTFLHGINAICENMHSPCLRLELLQYVLGLDNRYSVAHVARSVELAATCLGISTTTNVSGAQPR